MIPDTLQRALSRVEDRLLAGSDAEALLARRSAGRPADDDDRRAAELTADLVASQAPDGSWGNVAATAEALILYRELAGETDAGPAITGALDWLRGWRGAPGRFGDGCDPGRHELGLCEHFLAGFFAPGPGGAGNAELVVRCGARLPAGTAARIGASCLALRAFLHWRAGGPDVELHLEGIRRLLLLILGEPAGPIPDDALPPMLHALLDAPRTAENIAAAHAALAWLARTQRGDGSWAELDVFLVLETLLDAPADADAPAPDVGAMIRRAAGLLAVTQQPGGGWVRDADSRQLRIAWRALRRAIGSPAQAPQHRRNRDDA